ncbi:MAG: DUF5995 family protein [Bacteroidota bacterium]
MRIALISIFLLSSALLFGSSDQANPNDGGLCDYGKLLEGVNDQERQLREELYLTLVGIIEELQRYRTALATNQQYIDMFPAVYYHVTAIETHKIRKGNFDEPVWKMSQMIAFYEEYVGNRRAWDSGSRNSVEPHWKTHFQKAIDVQAGDAGGVLCLGYSGTLLTAVKAHIIYDLPRSIRFANMQYSHSRQTDMQKVKREFDAVNDVFSRAQARAIDDLRSISPACSELSSYWLSQWLFGPDVVDMRTTAWNNALDAGHVVEFEGVRLAPHPYNQSIWDHFLNRGKDICPPPISTLFLFDMSGSMSQTGGGTIPKIEQAKNAGRTTLQSLQSNNQGPVNEVAIYGFEGACVPDPTTEIFYFSRDLQQAEQSLDRLYTGGGTPLGKAIRSAECKLAEHLTTTGKTEGRLILLSDGQGTCGEIRPQGVYQNAPLKRQRYNVSAGQCGGSVASNVSFRYYTVGFNIPPGSPAERDLQYLSTLTGGKYLNVQNQTQLTRAFRKFNRVYRPKPYPLESNLSTEDASTFQSGVSHIRQEDFSKAVESNEAYVKAHPDDCHGVFNLALAYEATDLFREAITQYESYLRLCPNPEDEAFVRQQLAFLAEEYQDFLAFQEQVIQSDLEFLRLHFERLQNGRSVALAMEFRGFLQEKGDYYERLPRLIDQKNRFFVNLTEDISSAFDRCATMIRRNPEHWDRDAIPVISITYLNLQDLISEM